MKTFSLFFIAIIAFGQLSFAETNSCLRFYGQRAKATFFTTPIGERGIIINEQTILDAKSAFQKRKVIDALQKELSDLYDRERRISRGISKSRSERPLIKLFSSDDPRNIKIDLLKEERKQVTSAIKEKSERLKGLKKAYQAEMQNLDQQYVNNGTKALLENVSLAHLKKSLKDPSTVDINTRNQITFDASSNIFSRQYYITVNMYGSPITIPVLVKTGFRINKTGSLEVYSYVVGSKPPTSGKDKLRYLAALEIFKRNSMLSPEIQIKNGSTIEQKFKKLGFDLTDVKVQALIAKLKEKQFTDAKAAARAQELIDAANARYQDGLNDSQNLYLIHYLNFLAFSQNTTAFVPPNHWVLYHLQHATPTQHAGLAESFTKATELANDKSVSLNGETFDSIVKMDTADILSVREALDSPEYKSELISGGIADVLGISESRIEQMNSARIDDPAFSGGSEAETKTQGADFIDSSGPSGGSDSTVDSAPVESPPSGGGE